MKHWRLLLATTTLASSLSVLACQKASNSSGEGLNELKTQVKEIDGRLAKIEKLLGPYLNRPPRPPEPDPSKVYSVPIDGNPFKGPESAPVTVVKAFEFACPYCERARPTMDTLLKDYSGKVKVVYKHFVVHPDVATLPAIAVCAAAKQGKFAEMEEKMWEDGFKKRELGRDAILKMAKDIKLDEKQFTADLDGEECKQRVQQDQDQLAKLGIQGTPGFFINGRFLGGAQPVENFKKLVDEELKKAEAKIAQGTPVDQYYQKAVVEAGIREVKAEEEKEEKKN